MIHKYQYGAPVYVPDLKTLKATRRLIGRGTRKVAEYGLKGLGWLGEALNNVVTAGASSDFGQTSPFTFSTGQERRNILKGREQVRLQAKLKIDQGMTWVSPLNYGAALWNGHGLNAEKGAEEISTWDPRWQLLGRVGEMFTVAKGKPTVKAAVRTGDRVLAKAGNRGAKLRVISRELSKNITEATKNGRIEVTNAYFAAPDKWYRVSERPEKIGIELNGKNVTTSDDPGINGTINGWRESMLSLTGRVVPGKGSNEGYFIFQPRKISLSKHGAAHGNTSQAAKGQIWLGTFAFSDRFPIGIIEGQAPMKVFRGMNEVGKDSRTNFVLQDWDKIPLGARIGFHTGEMPMSNLGWFLKTKNGTFTYEPIISEKRIEIKPSTKLKRILSEKTYPWYRGKQYSINEVVNPDGTVNPRQAMKILHEVSEQFPGSYKMEHRLENPEWHQNDPTTYYHTKKVAQSAWHIDPPKGFTKQDLMIAALGHDFGKIVAGDGHAQIGADLARLVFPDLTDALYTAIAQHMGNPTTPLGKVTKQADITNGRHSYSGYTPTKLSPIQSKFVKDVMQGHKWGMNRGTKSISNKDFTKLLEGKERIGYGAETSVYEHPTNPLQVLKVYPSGSNGFSSPQVAMLEGLIFTSSLNNLPYNLPVNLEGTLKRHGSFFPVFSQRKVYIPLMDQPKIIDFDKSVNGMYSLEKPNINNILLENGIQGAKDFKLPNLGLLPDGTVMGIDLWKKGGKINI